MEKAFPKQQDEHWRVLEFFSGIGGMRYSLLSAGVDEEVVQAFDINDKANDVYEHNFGDRPLQHSSDARAFSFLKILELMLQSSRPPVMLFMENVGFETSDTHTKMVHFKPNAFWCSIFQTTILLPGGNDVDKAHSMEEAKLGYFIPREVADLHSFPEDFQFPQHIGLRQRYALLGNSLRIAVVAPLLPIPLSGAILIYMLSFLKPRPHQLRVGTIIK